jgi:hypothetical protein
MTTSFLIRSNLEDKIPDPDPRRRAGGSITSQGDSDNDDKIHIDIISIDNWDGMQSQTEVVKCYGLELKSYRFHVTSSGSYTILRHGIRGDHRPNTQLTRVFALSPDSDVVMSPFT